MKTFSAGDGQAFTLVLVVTMILLVLTFTLSTLTMQQHQNVIKEEYFLRTLNAAEVGVEATIARIKGEAFWYDNFPSTPTGADAVSVFSITEWENQAFYEVKAKKFTEEIGTSLHIKSIGMYKTGEGETAGKKTLQSVVGVFNAGDCLRGLAVLPAESSNIELDGGLVLDGDLLINGAAAIASSTVINGVVYATGNITGTWGGPGQAGYLFVPPFPDLEEEVYLINASAYGEVYAIDASFGVYAPDESDDEDSMPVTEYEDIYFVDGDISIGGSYRGTALFFATGGITVMGDLEPECGEDGLPNANAGMLALVALGDVDIQAHTVHANILTAGSLRALGGAVLYGSACTAGVDFDTGTSYEPVYIYHRENLAPIEDFISTKTKIVDWQEQYPVFAVN